MSDLLFDPHEASAKKGGRASMYSMFIHISVPLPTFLPPYQQNQNYHCDKMPTDVQLLKAKAYFSSRNLHRAIQT